MVGEHHAVTLEVHHLFKEAAILKNPISSQESMQLSLVLVNL